MKKSTKNKHPSVNNLRGKIMNAPAKSIGELLDDSNKGLIGFGYRQIKSSAEEAAKLHGCEWAKKYPATAEAIQLRQRLRDLVLSYVPKTHSNRDVVWQRYRQYALKFCGL